VNQRAVRLFADGYRAVIQEDLTSLVTSPQGNTYRVNPVDGSCPCAFQEQHRLPCKHSLGLFELLQDQQRANLPGYPFGPNMKFALGHMVVTAGADEALARCKQSMLFYLRRHSLGDWGEVDKEDKRANDADVNEEDRLLSAYTLPDGTKLWVITEWDRSATTCLLPDEY
jgi:hypothetical protein